MAIQHYYKSNAPKRLGDDDPKEGSTSVSDVIGSPTVKLASGVALTYHGYRRTGSVLWALVYGLIGKWKPQVGVPIALAQGFGKTKGGGS